MSHAREISKVINLVVDDQGAKAFDSDALQISIQKSVTGIGTIGFDSEGLRPAPNTLPAGTQVFITSSQILYITDGTSYKTILKINNTPFFTASPDPTYALSTTGGLTFITVIGQDSDGQDNVTFTATGNAGFNSIATVAVDSEGADGTRFVITPIDSEGGTKSEGTGILTFAISDGKTTATTNSSFSIVFVYNWGSGSYSRVDYNPKMPGGGSAANGYAPGSSNSGFGQFLKSDGFGERVLWSNSEMGSGYSGVYVRKYNSATNEYDSEDYISHADIYWSDSNNRFYAGFGDGIDIDHKGERMCLWNRGERVGGKSSHGAVYVYKRNTTTNKWYKEQGGIYIQQNANNRYFGNPGPKISGDGAHMLVPMKSYYNGSNAGVVYYYSRSGSTWSNTSSFNYGSTGDYAGVDDGGGLDSDASRVLVTRNAGRSYVLTRSGTSFSAEFSYTTPSGTSSHLTFSKKDMSYYVVADGAQEKIYIHSRSGTSWTTQTIDHTDLSIAAGTGFGARVSINDAGDLLAVGNKGYYTGKYLWLLKRTGSSWSLLRTIDETGDSNIGTNYGYPLLTRTNDRLFVSDNSTVNQSHYPDSGGGVVFYYKQT